MGRHLIFLTRISIRWRASIGGSPDYCLRLLEELLLLSVVCQSVGPVKIKSLKWKVLDGEAL